MLKKNRGKMRKLTRYREGYPHVTRGANWGTRSQEKSSQKYCNSQSKVYVSIEKTIQGTIRSSFNDSFTIISCYRIFSPRKFLQSFEALRRKTENVTRTFFQEYFYQSGEFFFVVKGKYHASLLSSVTKIDDSCSKIE